MVVVTPQLKPLNFDELSPPLNKTLITDVPGLEKVSDFIRREKRFSVDTETNMTSSVFDRKIRTIQIGNRNEQYIIDLLAFAGSTERLMEQGHYKTPEWAKEIVDVLKIGLFSSEHLKVGVGVQFEYEVFKWCLGLRTFNYYDCHLAEKVIYAGYVRFDAPDFWGMDNMTARYAHLSIDKTLQASFDLESPLTEDQLNYCALDVRLPLAIQSGQALKITSAKLDRAVSLENEAIPPVGDMKLNGMKVSREKWAFAEQQAALKHIENIKALDKHFIPVVGSKADILSQLECIDLDELESVWRNEKDKERRVEARKNYNSAKKAITEFNKKADSYEGEAAINYGSHDQLLKALYQLGFSKKALPNTNNKTLEKLKSKHPVIEAIQEFRSSEKILSTYGLKFIDKHTDPTTGRIHSNIDQLGAETGRTTSSAPNLQNIPAEEVFRSSFVAEVGYKILTVDYNGCELRIMAEASQEKVWLEAFLKDWDVHSYGAEILFGKEWTDAAEPGCAYVAKHGKCKCKLHKILRDRVKAINFGLAYGKEARALAEDLKISFEEAEELLKRYRSAFPTVTAYLKSIGDYARMNCEARTLSNRRRGFTKPTWELAKQAAIKKFLKDKKNPQTITSTDINRIYHAMFSSIEREGKNTPIQGTNADIAKSAAAIMWPELEPKYGAKLILFVHDEFVVECPEDTAQDCFKFVSACMTKAGEEFVKSIPMTTEGHIADFWTK